MPCTITPFRETDLHGEPVKVLGAHFAAEVAANKKDGENGPEPDS